MNIEQLFKDHNIRYVTEGHKHARPGWVNTVCPFCTGNPGYHLGYDLEGNKFVCWRCGGHSILNTVSALIHCSINEAKVILSQYGVRPKKATETKRKPLIKSFHLPAEVEPLSKAHKNYLRKRGFDPDELEQVWGLVGTGIYCRMDKIDYSRRIVIPYYWNGKMVSFDSRDITGKAVNKYMACSKLREIINHKHILYGRQEHWLETGIIVEGTTDVWRMGVEAAAVSGIKYTPQQVRLIAKHFTRAAIIFDGGETQAKLQADKLVADLKFRKVDAFRIDIEGDPGGLSQTDAKKLKDFILKKIY